MNKTGLKAGHYEDNGDGNAGLEDLADYLTSHSKGGG
jgi:hypothetical protein